MMKQMFDKKSFLFRYVSMLIVLLCIPVVFGFLVSRFAVASTLSQIKSKNYQSLVHIQKILDSEFLKLERITYDITFNQDLIHLYSVTEPGDLAYEVSRSSLIPKSVPLNDYIMGTYIYLDTFDYVIYGKTYAPFDEFYQTNGLENLSAGEFKAEYLTPGHVRRISATQTAYTDGKSIPVLLYTHSFPVTGTYKGSVFMMIDLNKFIEPFADNLAEEGICLYALDKDGQIIFSRGNESYIITDAAEQKDGYYSNTRNGEKFIYCTQKSDFGNFRYILVESDRSIQSATSPVRLMIYLYMVVTLVLGCIVIFSSARKNAKPIRDLSLLLNTSLDTHYQGDELDNIQLSIHHLLNEKIRMEPILEASESTLKKNIISDLLRGNFTSADALTSACRTANITFTHDFFVVFYFSLAEVEQSDIPIIKYAISNVLTEIFEPIGQVVTNDSELFSLFGILNLSENTKQIQEKILTQLNFLQAFFAKQFSILINIGIGRIYEGIENIALSCSNAKEAAEFCTLTGARDIMPYEEIKEHNDYYHYSLEEENKLFTAVMNGDIIQSKQLLNQIVEENSQLSLDMSRCLFFDLTATALKIMSGKTIDSNSVFDNGSSALGLLMNCKTITQLTETIYAIFEKVCQEINNHHSMREEKLIDDVTNYMNENYGNPNMSMSMVADAFSLNYTYVSHFFKDYLGASFVEYISELRVRKAAELLRSTSLSISRIADEVGYANATVLIKIFKKYTGITPGTYRKNNTAD